MILQIPSTNKPNTYPFEINHLGTFHDQESIYREGYYPYYLWIFTESGSGEVIINGMKYNVSNGQFFILFPNQHYSYKAISDKWIIHFIAVSGKSILEALNSFNIYEFGVYNLSNSGLFLEYLNRVISLSKENANELEYSKVCYSMLVDLLQSIQKFEYHDQATENFTVKKIVNFLESNYMNTNLSLDMLEEEIKFSKYHLERIFKAELGVSIIKYLLNLRLLKSRSILKNQPSLTVKEVCTLCGFESPSYFIKKFKQANGITPERYRKQIFLKAISKE